MEAATLIRLLESAKEGSEYLDYTIQRRSALEKPVPPYTRSVDAAMSLIPDGWSIHRLQRRPDCRGNFGEWFAELFRANDAVLGPESRATAATAALAIAAVSMRVSAAFQREAAIEPSLPQAEAARAPNGNARAVVRLPR